MISRNCGLIRTGLMVGAGLALLSTFGMGCSNVTNQDKCFLEQSGICALEHDPVTDRPGLGQCLAAAANTCNAVQSLKQQGLKAEGR